MKLYDNSISNTTRKLVEKFFNDDVHFCLMYNERGEVMTTTATPTEDYSYLYDCELPFIHDILANYLIFNCFSKTTIVFYCGSNVYELTFDTLEELRLFYIYEC